MSECETNIEPPLIPIDAALEEVRHFARLLAKRKLEVLVTGSLASSLYTGLQHCQEVNLSIERVRGTEKALIELLLQCGEYVICGPPDIPASERGRIFSLVRKATAKEINVYIRDDPYLRDAKRRRRELPLMFAGDVPVYLQSPEDAVLGRLACCGLGDDDADHHWSILCSLLSAQRDKLDSDYLARWAGVWEISHVLERAKEQVEREFRS